MNLDKYFDQYLLTYNRNLNIFWAVFLNEKSLKLFILVDSKVVSHVSDFKALPTLLFKYLHKAISLTNVVLFKRNNQSEQ